MSSAATGGPSDKSVFFAGLVGLLAAVLVGSAEFALHFTPSLDYGGPEYEFFLGTSSARLTYGHFVSIFSAPLYFVGYWHLFHRMKPAPAKARSALLVLGIYSFALGGVWIGSRVYPAILVQAREAAVSAEARAQLAELLSTASFYNETVLIGLRVGVLALSLLFIWIVVTKRSSYPRWFALCNPILLVLLSFVVYFIAPSVGGYLMPIAMNVAHFVLFGVSLLLMRRTTTALET